MSVVACRVTEKGYTIAADSITVYGYTQRKGDGTDYSKLFEVNGLLVGGVGKAEETSLFHLFAKTRRPSVPTEGALLEFLSEFAEWKKKKVGTDGLNNHYIIGIDDTVFSVNGWHIHNVTNFDAIGAGFEYALAALHLDHSPEEAVKVAIELCIYCEGPVQVLRREVAA